ncbi:hypothetical protein Dimus_033096 [Dionaea muscipula]
MDSSGGSHMHTWSATANGLHDELVSCVLDCLHKHAKARCMLFQMLGLICCLHISCATGLKIGSQSLIVDRSNDGPIFICHERLATFMLLHCASCSVGFFRSAMVDAHNGRYDRSTYWVVYWALNWQ